MSSRARQSKMEEYDVDVVYQKRKEKCKFKGTYGLVIVAAAFCSNCVVISPFIGFGVIYITLSEVFQQPKAVLGWIGSLHIFSHRAVGLVSSVVIDRYGCRPVVMMGSLMVGFGCLGAAFAKDVPVLYLTYGVVAGIGTGMCVLASMVVLPTYFKAKKRLAIGIGGFGFSVGALLTAPLLQYLINHLGWRGALLILGGISLQSVVFGALMKPFKMTSRISNINKRSKPVTSFCCELWDFSLLRNLNISLYITCNVLYCFGFNTFLQHLSSRAVAHGVNSDSAALLTSIISIGTISIRLPTTLLAQWKRTNVILLFSMAVTVGGVLIVLMGLQKSYPYMVAFTVMTGCCIGIFYTTQFMVALEIAGQDKLARVQGITLFFQAMVSLFITPAAGWLYDFTGNYDIPFFVMGGFQVLGGLLFLPVSFRKLNKQNKTDGPANQLEMLDTKIKDDQTIEIQK